MTRTHWHWLSLGANAGGLLMCLWALSVHPEYFRGLGLLIGWMLINGAVATTALRGKG